MKNAFLGFDKIFSFTLSQQLKTRSFKTWTIILALACLIIPMVLIPVIAVSEKNNVPEEEYLCLAENVIIADEAQTGWDFSMLPAFGGEEFSKISFKTADSLDAALEEADDNTLVACISENADSYTAKIVIPDDSPLTYTDAGRLESLLYAAFPYFQAQSAGLDAESLAMMSTPVYFAENQKSDMEGGDAVEEDEFASTREVLGYLLPYLNIMVLYFLILIYGQGVANSVIMEKTSKLMDTFLIAVQPPAMVLGKVLATCCAAIFQFALWVVALFTGLLSGCLLAKALVPGTGLAIVTIFSNLSFFSGIFSVSGIIVGLLIALAGFLLYCSLSAIGGAMAGKPEDLSSTNVLFTMSLVVAFLLTLYSGGLSGTLSAQSWLNYFPFTAVLIVPAQAILGTLPIGNAIISLVIILVTALIFMYIAGRIYKLLALYKGDTLKPRNVFKMLKNK